MTAFYEILDESNDDGYAGTFRSSEHTAGPWDPGHQHGGPPSALLARAAERITDGLLARVTVDILGPIPVDVVRVEARIARPGKRISLVEATLLDHERPVARMAAWRIRQEPVDVPATATAPPPPNEGALVDLPFGWGGGYLDVVEWRWVEGNFTHPGAGTVWTRLLIPLVAGEETSGVQRAIAVADAGSGVSAVADPRHLIFINTELTVHFHRRPAGERIWMSAQQVLDRDGVGLAQTTLGDERGGVGAGAQSLLVMQR